MDSRSIMVDWDEAKAEKARRLCDAFLSAVPSKRFVFGRNIYAAAVVSRLDVAAVVDDFTTEREFVGAPIVRTTDIPPDAIVLAASGGRPLTVRRILQSRSTTQLDYFTLLKWGNLNLPEAVFNEGFRKTFERSRNQVDWLFGILADMESRDVLKRLLSFRYSYDIDCLSGFEERQAVQYFEPFLDLRRSSPVFVDVGGFDGFTSEQFIKRVPDYKAIYVFEPDFTNYTKCEKQLSSYGGVTLLPYGAGRQNAVLRFSANGSASSIRADGEAEIIVRRLDDTVGEIPTFIKMDIEGEELSAIGGACQIITAHRPTMALCVYHRPTDFWEVPQAVLAMAPDYDVYLRHYTESIYETVMYFVPRNQVRYNARR